MDSDQYRYGGAGPTAIRFDYAEDKAEFPATFSATYGEIVFYTESHRKLWTGTVMSVLRNGEYRTASIIEESSAKVEDKDGTRYRHRVLYMESPWLTTEKI